MQKYATTAETEKQVLEPVSEELQKLRDGYSATHRRWEIVCLLAFCATVTPLAWMVWKTLSHHPIPYLPFVMVGAVIIGVFGADIGSGLLHWGADNWGSVNLPIIGESLIRSFRHHHLAPKDITSHDFIELNGFPSLGAQVPVMMGFACQALPPLYAVLGGTAGVVFGVGILFTNTIHSWAHQDSPPRLARLLQRYRLILTPENHEQHHTTPYDRHYCITTGWSNPMLRKIRFFEGLEWCITKVTGIRPQHALIEEKMLEADSSVAHPTTKASDSPFSSQA